MPATFYPATPKQRQFLNTLREERGMAPLGATDLDVLSKGDASHAIKHLMEMPKAPAQTGSLMDMAKAIETGTPVVAAAADEADYEAVAAEVLVFNREECKALRSAISVAIGETDGTPMDHALYERIDAFLNDAAAPAPAWTVESAGVIHNGVVTPFVPDGHYAFGPDGDVKFYRVQHGKPGSKWDGFVFVDQQASDDYLPVKVKSVKQAILERIARHGILACAQRYGHELGVCGICHKTLTDPQSIADGIGPVCKAKIGG